MADDVLVVEASAVRRSASIAALAAALAKAQGEMAGAAKDKTNPHFKSSYADLASVWDACRGPLSANGLAVLQPCYAVGGRVTVTTILAHSSGEFIEVDLVMTATQATPQGIGSAITYARRYALSSMVGVAPEDDDGNAASQQGPSRPQAAPRPAPAPAPAAEAPEGYDEWLTDLEAVADKGIVALRDAWKKSQPYMRKYLQDTNNAKWEAMKAKAEQVAA
jgi:hypothetical protein